MPMCNECGAHVSDRFARVFGDDEDRVAGCLSCRRAADLAAGAGADRTRRADYIGSAQRPLSGRSSDRGVVADD
ncbi:hypothetical protein [Natrinema sp. SYSU A 869]|uniref:DUF7563 family protein n=1 Tax=Natrinema sp. SYSU A 869 TaxID=2871694 RepID=UPI001CA4579E|nr:hypothetical protein [Natrinema sp. SYSU A 869]